MTPEDRIAERLLRWEESWEHGRDVPPTELCADAPELEPVVRERIAALKATAWLKDPAAANDADEVDRAFPFPDPLGGRYQIEGLIAEGGQGRVYRAFDLELQRHVAVKIPRRDRGCGPEQGDLFLEEARRAAGLRHPGVVAVHDVGRCDGYYFIVSDLIEGESLADRIARDRPTPADAVRVAIEVAEALHFAHERGFVHRDVKPANILLDRQGRPHVTDFGIAATTEELARGLTASAGTLPYMAPEQVAGESQLIDARTDLYALGVVLYELLAGRSPYKARTLTILREQILFRPPHPMPPKAGVPAHLERLVLRCLAKHPADRFASAKELADELRAVFARPTTRRRAWPTPFLLATTILVVVAAVLWRRPAPDSSVRSASTAGSRKPATESTPVGSPPTRDGAIVFDGRTRIITPVERFAPATLEAWVWTDDLVDDMFIVGSDIPYEYGIGFGLNQGYANVETLKGGFLSRKMIRTATWTHIAVVYGSTRTTLYVDGEKIQDDRPTEVSGGTPFVVGNVGEGHKTLYFSGLVRSLCISKSERYLGGFTPPTAFPKGDADAVLIYDGSHVEGDRVIDLSGNGRHGWIEKRGG